MLRNNNNICVPQNKNHTTQKTTHYGEQKPERVAEYKEQIKKYPNEKRIYVDEAGFDSYLYRKYARAPKGQKVNEAIKGNKNERTSIVSEKMGHDIIVPLQYKGTMHGDFFETWFKKYLLPDVPKDGVVIFDNASFHRKKRLYEIAEKHQMNL